MDGSSAEKFLERLRATDERTKWKISIIASIICMVIIIFLWMISFSILIAPGAGNAPTATAQAAAAQPSGPGFWESVKNNANGIYQKFTNGVGDALHGSKQYTIQPQQ